VILRKAFGGAYIVMGSKHLGADWVAAWPHAQIAVLGANTAIQIIHGKALAEMDDDTACVQRAHLETDYTEKMLHPYVAASHGYIDAIIEPKETRAQIVRALDLFQNKVVAVPHKRTGNGPL
jgi:propionyl-CoA carboxylase beta chain